MLRKMPSKLVHKRGLVPVGRKEDSMRVATSDPYDVYAFDELRMLSGLNIEPVLASESEIQRVIRKYYGVGGQTVSEMIDDLFSK